MDIKKDRKLQVFVVGLGSVFICISFFLIGLHAPLTFIASLHFMGWSALALSGACLIIFLFV